MTELVVTGLPFQSNSWNFTGTVLPILIVLSSLPSGGSKPPKT